MLSVLIPARNEIYLQKTIESTLAAAKGEIEIIATLDGYWPDPPIPDDPRVILIHHTEAIGQRPAVNEAAKIAKGKYILKTDGHSMFDEGFDVKLAADCEYDWTVLPRMYNLDVENWKPKTHKTTDFMWINSMDEGKQDKPFRALYWDGRTAKKYPEYYKAYKRNPMYKGGICDVMTGQGACWFMHKDRFWELGGMDEAHGHWGQVGVEVALKAWLSGGSHKVNKKTWFAHYFRGGSGPGFPWPANGRKQEAARKYSREFWSSGKWPLQKRPLSWLVEKFAPLPNWNGHSKLISIPSKKEPAVEVKTDLTLLYYTANTCTFEKKITERLKEAKYPIVSISQKPIDLGINICIGEIGRSLQNIYRQVLKGAKKATTEYVALIEDDCLYVPEHFEYRPTKNCFAYNLNRWLLHPSGVFSYRERPVLSQCIAPRKLLIECLEERFKLEKIPKKYCGEMGLFEKKLGIKEYPYETFKTKNPNVVVCHDKDTSGRKYYGKDAPWRTNLEPWGNGDALIASLYTFPTAEKDMNKRNEIVLYGRRTDGVLRDQRGLIAGIVFDVNELHKNRMRYVDTRKPAQLQRFLDCFPSFLKAVVEKKGNTSDEWLEAQPYYNYMIDHLNPADRIPKVSGKGRYHVLNQLKEVYKLYCDIRDNGLKAPLDLWRRKGQSELTIHRGGRRLEMLKLLGIKTVPGRIFKSKQVFRAHDPNKGWVIGPAKSDSIHSLAIKQFIEKSHMATDKYWVHNYTRLYDKHLSHLKDKPIKILEIGVLHGASLLLWEEAFPNAQIYGVDKIADLWKENLEGHERIKVFVGRQEDAGFLNKEVIPAGPFDVIIDDGGHQPKQQVAAFRVLWPHLNENGIYVQEDLYGNWWRSKDGPLMMEEIKNKLDETCAKDDALTTLSVCMYYNICFIEKKF